MPLLQAKRRLGVECYTDAGDNLNTRVFSIFFSRVFLLPLITWSTILILNYCETPWRPLEMPP